MKTLLKDVIKLGSVLAAFAVTACVCLALMNQITKPIIDGHDARRTERSLKSLFPKAESFEKANDFLNQNDSTTFLDAYSIMENGILAGLAIKASGPSYGGNTTLMVGIDVNSIITGVIVLENNDTPGLGANVKNAKYYVDKKTETTFPGQFAGKSISDSFTVKQDIIPITASTITSRAITSVVKEAGDAAVEYLNALGGVQ